VGLRRLSLRSEMRTHRDYTTQQERDRHAGITLQATDKVA
jgi:hypothetical protein